MKAIIVFYDSLNKRYLPAYNPECDTIAPNFTRLAKQSVQFNNSYVGSMPCIPARREFHTGRYNFLHREWGPLEPFDDSLPEHLKKQGIYTHLISDHLHYWEDGGANYHTRYSSWEIVRGQEGDHWKGQVRRPDIPPVVKVPRQQSGEGESGLWRYDWVNRQYIVEKEDFPQKQCFDRGIEFIEKNKDADHWLLHLETFDPHEPFYAPREYLDLYPEEYDGRHFDWPRGEAVETAAEIDHCRRNYKALVTMCDDQLGRILDLMDRYQLWDDTMLIVGTDHGFLLAEHGHWGKNQMPYYNEIANNPLFIWDPRSGVKGEERSSLVQMIDWAPTLYDYFQVSCPADVQGRNLAETIRTDQKVRDYALFGVFSGHVNITDGRYVYMRAPQPDKVDEIYNYTLMPQHMNQRYSVEEMQTMTLQEPFSFTKGCRVMKIKGKEKYKVSRYGTLLFDLAEDPGQEHPVADLAVEQRFIRALADQMKQNDSPEEQYERLGIKAGMIELRNIRTRVPAADWREAVRQSGELLAASNYITRDYINLTISSIEEMGPYVVLMPGLALAHARPDASVLKTGLSLITLEQPVNFGCENDPVSVVLTLACRDSESHLKMLGDLAVILADPEQFRLLAEADREEDIYNILN